MDVNAKYGNSKCYIEIKNMTSNYPKNFALVPTEYEKTYQELIFEPTCIPPINETGSVFV